MIKLGWDLLWTIINLVVLYLLLKKFLFKPVNNIIEKRKNLVEEGFNQAQQAQEQADSLKEKYQTALEGSKAESEEIVAKAKLQAKNEYERMMREAEQKSDKMMETARNNIELERSKVLSDLKSQIATVAVSAAENVLGKNGDAVDNQELYDQFLKEVGENDEESDN